jgi:methionine-rich copper-binding protein CopC
MADPTRRGRSARRHSIVLALLSALVSIPLLLLNVGPASAHTKLVSSSPAEGAALTGAPTQVVLDFDEVPVVKTVRAQSTDGTLVALGTPVQSGAHVTVSWPTGTAPGLYRLVYSLVSDDGDPVEGTLLFSYAGTATSAAPAALAAPVDTTSGGSTSMRIALVVGLGLVSAAAAGVLVMSRRRSRKDSDEAQAEAGSRIPVRADV